MKYVLNLVIIEGSYYIDYYRECMRGRSDNSHLPPGIDIKWVRRNRLDFRGSGTETYSLTIL